MVIGGGVLAFLGWQEWSLASGTEAEPRQISCEELGGQGPGDNPHVEMGDFVFCDYYVSEGTNDSDIDRVWVAAVPFGGDYHVRLMEASDEEGNIVGNVPPPTDVRVIVKSSKVSSEYELVALGDQETIKGMVVNEISSLKKDEKDLLRQGYPSIDFDKVQILEHARKPAGFGKVFAMLGGGLALVLVGGVVGFGSLGQE